MYVCFDMIDPIILVRYTRAGNYPLKFNLYILVGQNGVFIVSVNLGSVGWEHWRAVGGFSLIHMAEPGLGSGALSFNVCGTLMIGCSLSFAEMFRTHRHLSAK